MQFDAGTWWVISLLITAAIGVIAYFLRRTIAKQDEHERSINNIKLTYVTQDQLADTKSDLRDEIKAMRSDIGSLKDTTLSRADFFRSQAATEGKIDKMYDLLIKVIKEANHGE